ncbi:hypothetical protein COW36_22470 [bacterium (Candidatus Blackallbacteria) CG17_big_fil_post_rev_8_21_14_2_50_48_46]|uniref:Uncharacterized protein n=1 Tax=bacterium (Candidatus Blackallbacteria) CG17_big_fil_post_rev_8_21_14_2_50_48_46 TaxID=2014261 RepID=A0A2M7FY73_9BACT|nr:MAG: hypothetical protein COW64_05695 [bacterium (Candidatus Blackallbacteria) CG18_big_fil_WC_8_21_14_2_50_49_26]PIW14237.1 MAG: hypothetical protein COW36_22470 [bacterium (Candidatus Blackallbacteria) CG17_big_fil_post_rev_8_21_14_2_50_48_46]PIW46958.1 MAG: hypothetical protein COW20_14020 [bacterium (Candidatus Blackallbacteria) CG13_big_fil_rev_8_21_14_2_50_49_14]
MKILSLILPLAFAWGGEAQTPEQRLAAMIGPSQMQVVQNYRKAYKTAYTLPQWNALLKQGRQMEETLSKPLSARYESWNQKGPQPDFSWVEPLVPGMKVTYQAEGTVLIMALDYTAFAKLAARTPEPADDQLVSLLIKAQGDHASPWPNWFMRTWDYGGCTQLGTGLHLEILKELQRQQKTAPFFQAELKRVREDLFRDFAQIRSFCQPQAKVLKEVSALMAVPGLSLAEQKTLKGLQTELKTSKKAEYNCLKEMSNCRFGQ